MAKAKKFGYMEPADYFPPEIREMFEKGEFDKKELEEKKNEYRDQSKRMIAAERKKKATKK